ncbi:RNA polymerase factor sigma-54 [Devosia pacifica]|nr:RNA polymerase factor sigma-54 [Devosia pacifica]
MALSPRLEVRQAQSLSLTPQLMQSIRLLQLGHLELNGFVEAELLRNPLLERDEAGDDAPGEAQAAVETLDASFSDTFSQSSQLPSAEAIADGYDTSVENVFPEQPAAEPGGPLRDIGIKALQGGEAPDLDQYVASGETLSDHLEAQTNLLLKTQSDRLIARYLTDNLDENGYLAVPLDQGAAQLGCEIEDIEAVLLAVQGCDPVGVYARDLAECLAMQLRERDRLDPVMQRLLQHLDLLAAHDLAGLMRLLACDREDLAEMIAEIRALDPRPARAYETGPLEAVVPDVFVRPGSDGGWQLELNTEVLPRVLVNRVYYASVSKRTRDRSEKAFLTDCLQTANWLAKSLDQRAQTILKVATEIVRQQDAFLVNGVAHLRPMTLRMVAEAIDMHESTVSRVTANKYLMTPRGLFEMKYFFTTAIASSAGGSDHSAEAVRHRIRELIEAETAKSVLSDDTIAEMLKREQGIDVARRTVAKYREGMNIPSSVVRRRQKKSLEAIA